MLTFTLLLPVLLGFYFLESIKYNQLNKFFELVWGSVVGYLYPLKRSNYIALPKLKT